MTGAPATAAPNAESMGWAKPPLGHAMDPAWWHQERRFKPLGEAEHGGQLGKGGYGTVFLAFDKLRQEQVVIKRQEADTAAAAREIASYTMLQAFPHDNLLAMHGMWTAEFNRTTHVYIATEVCNTNLWQCIG